MAGELDGSVAVVTGGNSGIGRAVVLELARLGARVVVDYVAAAETADVLELQVADLGSEAYGVEADVSRVADVRRLADQAVRRFGRLDIWVNNAGIETRTGILDTTEAEYDRVLGVNLKGAFFGTQVAAQQMVEQGGGGRIVNVSSVHEDWPMPGNAPYCVSKGGMRMLTRTAGVTLASHGIHVVGVAPGAVDTPINAGTMADEEAHRALERSIPLGRVARPEEVARVVGFVAGPGADYLTATTVVVDGGIMQAGLGL